MIVYLEMRVGNQKVVNHPVLVVNTVLVLPLVTLVTLHPLFSTFTGLSTTGTVNVVLLTLLFFTVIIYKGVQGL